MRLSIQSIEITNYRPMSTICQGFNTIDVEVCFTRNGDFTWRVSDCEELAVDQIEHLGRNESNYFLYLFCPADHTVKVAFTTFQKKCFNNKFAVIPFPGHV